MSCEAQKSAQVVNSKCPVLQVPVGDALQDPVLLLSGHLSEKEALSPCANGFAKQLGERPVALKDQLCKPKKL